MELHVIYAMGTFPFQSPNSSKSFPNRIILNLCSGTFNASNIRGLRAQPPAVSTTLRALCVARRGIVHSLQPANRRRD